MRYLTLREVMSCRYLKSTDLCVNIIISSSPCVTHIFSATKGTSAWDLNEWTRRKERNAVWLWMKGREEVYLFFLNTLQDAMCTNSSLRIKHVPVCFKSMDWGEEEVCDKRHFPCWLTSLLNLYTEQPPPKQGVLLLPLASAFYYLAGIVINDVTSVADMDPLGIARRYKDL